MKYMRINVLLKCLIFITLITSCTKDNEGFEIVQNFADSDIFGTVTNSLNDPISGAVVTYNGNIDITDKDGVYRFTKVQVGPQHNSLKIEKDGYFESSRTFRTAVSGVLYQSTILQDLKFDHSFQSSTSAEFAEGPVKINFPANAVVFEDSGEPYNGEVLVAISPIDPTEDQLAELMPGDLSAREDDNTISTLESFGMVNIEIQSPAGSKLQIADNKNVELSYRIPADLKSSAPTIIDMWWFDFDSGVWVKEGQATKSGDGVRYVGVVNHFSCWNYDVARPSVIVSGQVESVLGSLNYFQVSLLNAENEGGRGTTDDEGNFSGRVEAGVELTLTISHYGDCESTFSTPVGPFDMDTNLGVVMMDIDVLDFLNVTGTALDCDMNPITTGQIFILDQIFPITDGIIDIISPVCGPDLTFMRIVDILGEKQVILSEIPLPGQVELNEVIVCDDAFNITVDNLDAAPIVITDPTVQILYNNFNDLSRIYIVTDSNFSPFAEISYILGTGEIEKVEVGNYDLSFASFSNDSNSFSSETIAVGSMTIISCIDLGFANNIVGTYSAETTEKTTGEAKVITGSFNTILF